MAVVTAVGKISSEDARAQATEILRLAKENAAGLVLVDYLDALSEVSLTELYWLSYHAPSLGLPHSVRLALVMPRAPYRIESYQFFELVFRNAGYNFKVFRTRQEAEGWLAEPRVGEKKQFTWDVRQESPCAKLRGATRRGRHPVDQSRASPTPLIGGSPECDARPGFFRRPIRTKTSPDVCHVSRSLSCSRPPPPQS